MLSLTICVMLVRGSASESGDRRIICCSETSCGDFEAVKLSKGSSGARTDIGLIIFGVRKLPGFDPTVYSAEVSSFECSLLTVHCQNFCPVFLLHCTPSFSLPACLSVSMCVRGSVCVYFFPAELACLSVRRIA